MEIKPANSISLSDRAYDLLTSMHFRSMHSHPRGEKVPDRPRTIIELELPEDIRKSVQDLGRGRIDRSITTTVVAAEPEVDEGPQPL